MAISYTWSIVQMDAYPEVDGEQDVVFTTHWTVSGTDSTYTGSVYGTQNVPLSGSGSFTPYADLTEAQVIAWTQDAMGQEQVNAIQDNIAQQIENQISPPVVTPPLPWATPTV